MHPTPSFTRSVRAANDSKRHEGIQARLGERWNRLTRPSPKLPARSAAAVARSDHLFDWLTSPASTLRFDKRESVLGPTHETSYLSSLSSIYQPAHPDSDQLFIEGYPSTPQSGLVLHGAVACFWISRPERKALQGFERHRQRLVQPFV